MSMKIIAASLLVLAAMPVAAQGLSNTALRGMDSKAPIDVDADRIDVVDKQNEAVFQGNVRVRQAAMTLESDRIKVAYSKPTKGDPEVTRLEADGAVRIITPSERATSRFGVYDVQKRIMTLIGNVVLVQGSTKVQGNRLTMDLVSGRTTLDGRSSSGQAGSRVSGRFAVPASKN